MAKNNRLFINAVIWAVIWIFRTGAPWRDLPPEYGDWKKRIADFAVGVTRECGSICLTQATSKRTVMRQEQLAARKRFPAQKGASAKVRLAVDAHGMPVRAIVTVGAVAPISHAPELIHGIKAEAVIADKGYDSQEFVDSLETNGIEAVIPPRKNRKEQRFYDKHLYKARSLVENAFLRLKEWRGVAILFHSNRNAAAGAPVKSSCRTRAAAP